MNNIACANHWARRDRIQRMKWARQVQHDPERCAEWVAIARKLHSIYMRARRSHEQHMAWINGPKVNRDHVPYAERITYTVCATPEQLKARALVCEFSFEKAPCDGEVTRCGHCGSAHCVKHGSEAMDICSACISELIEAIILPKTTVAELFGDFMEGADVPVTHELVASSLVLDTWGPLGVM